MIHLKCHSIIIMHPKYKIQANNTFYTTLALLAALMLGNCQTDDSCASNCKTGPGESVTITGKLQVGASVVGAPEAAGTALKNGEVFVEGFSDAVVTDAEGNFSLQVPISGSLSAFGRRATAGQSIRLYAWKDYSLPANEFDGFSNSKLGTAQTITLEDQDLGTLELVWTNAGHFNVEFPDGVDVENLDYETLNENSQITVDGIPLLGSADLYYQSGSGKARFDIEYLPSGESYTIQIWIDGYEDYALEIDSWPENTFNAEYAEAVEADWSQACSEFGVYGIVGQFLPLELDGSFVTDCP